MIELSEKEKQDVKEVIVYVEDFLNKRFEYADRANPQISVYQHDMAWFEIQNLEKILVSTRNIGIGEGISHPTIAYFTSVDDDRGIEMLLGTGSKISLFREIAVKVREGEEKAKDEGQANAEAIKSIAELYRHLATPERFAMLVEHWIWWDFRSAVNLYRVDLQMNKLHLLSEMAELNDDFKNYYTKTLKDLNPGHQFEVTLDLVKKFEAKRTELIFEKLYHGLHDEEVHKRIIAYEDDDDKKSYNYKQRIIDEKKQELDAFRGLA